MNPYCNYVFEKYLSGNGISKATTMLAAEAFNYCCILCFLIWVFFVFNFAHNQLY